MENDELIQSYQDVIAANRSFTNLLDNPDFISWRETVVLPRLEGMRMAILTIDRTNPSWRESLADLLIAYQEANTTYNALFNLVETTVEMAKDEIKKLAEARA